MARLNSLGWDSSRKYFK